MRRAGSTSTTAGFLSSRGDGVEVPPAIADQRIVVR